MAVCRFRITVLLTIVSWSSLFTNDAWPVSASYTIDQNLSRISVVPSTFGPGPAYPVIAGTKFSSTYGIYEQKPGSLDSKISGTLTADVTGNTVTFNGTNLIDVVPNSQAPFLPHPPGSPGVEDNFGAYVQTAGFRPFGEVAVRDAVANLSSGSVTIGQPVTDQLSFYLTSGILDYHLVFPSALEYFDLVPSDTVTNHATGNFTGAVGGTIHIPFDLTFPYSINAPNDSLLVLNGEIVANRVAPSLVGDYNNNNVVDANDYVVWRKRVGTTIALPNDPIGGTIDTAQHTQWRSNFGSQGGTGSSFVLVPEPGTISLLFTALFIRFGPGRRNARWHWPQS
jgi:hypothetical protein